MKTALCTISSNNFLPYGLTCLTSVEKFNDYDLFYLIADDFKDDLYKKYEECLHSWIFFYINLFGEKPHRDETK